MILSSSPQRTRRSRHQPGIDRKSSFERVICQYIYLKYYQKYRRPQNTQQNLTSEEFNLILQDLLGSINIIFDDRIDWTVFRRAFRKLQRQYHTQTIDIRAIEVLPNQHFLVKLRVLPGLGVNAIEQYFWRQYKSCLLVQQELNPQNNRENH